MAALQLEGLISYAGRHLQYGHRWATGGWSDNGRRGGFDDTGTGSVLARPDTFDEVFRLSLEHVERSRLELGCVSHAVLNKRPKIAELIPMSGDLNQHSE